MNYKEWEETATVIKSIPWGSGNENIRDIYKIDNITVYDETILPRHWGLPQRHSTLIDIICPSSVWDNRLKSLGCVLDTGRYTEEGYGYIVFKGKDSLEKAFDFITNENSFPDNKNKSIFS